MLATIRSTKIRVLAKAMFCLGTIAFLTIPFALGCAPGPPGEKLMDEVIFKDSGDFDESSAPAFVGVEKGFWADEGIEVMLKPGGGISNAQLIASGVVRFASEGYGDVIEAVQQGMPIEAVFCFTQQSPIAIISRADNPIRHPKELEGKSVAGGPGSGNLALLPAVLKAAGADFSKVTVRIVDWGAIRQTLMLGKVDAIPMYWTSSVPELEAAGVETYFIKYSDYGINVLGEGLIVSDELIEENPDLIRRFVRAYKRAWEYTIEHPEEAVDILMKYNPDLEGEWILKALSNTIELVHTENTQDKPLGWMAKEDWEQSQDIMVEYIGLEKTLPVETYYTNEFISE